MKNIVPGSCLKLMYSSLILPYLTYCNIVWCCTYDSHLRPLIVLQKRAIRIICKQSYLAPSNELFFRQKILKLTDIRNFQLAIYAFENRLENIYLNAAPYNTRNSENLNIPFRRLTLAQHSSSYLAAKFWNSLPICIRNSRSVRVFKRNLKRYLIDGYEIVSNSTWGVTLCVHCFLGFWHRLMPTLIS